MSEIYDPILQYAQPQATAGDWAAVAAILNAPTVIQRHSAPVTYVKIRQRFGDTARKAVADTLRDSQNGDLRDAHAVLLDEKAGLDLSTDDRQALLDQVGAAAQWPADLIAGLKALGVTRRSPAAAYGLEPVTAEQCQAAWTQYLFEQDWATLRESTLWPAITQGRAATVAALRSIADQLEA